MPDLRSIVNCLCKLYEEARSCSIEFIRSQMNRPPNLSRVLQIMFLLLSKTESVHKIEKSAPKRAFDKKMTTTAMTKRAVNVTITSDLMCPWCWVGLRKLQKASKESNIDAKIVWKPFLLRPNMPTEGTPKGGTPASRAGAQMREAGESVGIHFTGLTDRTPNTTLFHATLKYLQDEVKLDSSTVTEFHELVFEGYFTLGVFPDQEGLLKAASKVKDPTVYDSVNTLYRNNASSKLSDLQKEVAQEAMEASRAGVSGVPSFAFNGHTAFSGAQPTDTFSRYLERFAE
jgi:predicted DsbA family dithiol-disulfide isomerase